MTQYLLPCSISIISLYKHKGKKICKKATVKKFETLASFLLYSYWYLPCELIQNNDCGEIQEEWAKNEYIFKMVILMLHFMYFTFSLCEVEEHTKGTTA